MSTLLSIQGLTKRFSPDAPPVVRAVDFRVDEGEIFALLGPSGCGKTTTLRLIAGFERADAGVVKLAGRTLCAPGMHTPPEKRGIGLVFQDYALFPHLSVLKNVRFGLRGIDADEQKKRAEQALDLVGLSSLKDRVPQHLSGGQQQRVALARALAPRPQLLLLDEPFSNLDALLRQSTREEIRSLLKEWGTTAVLVTHDQEEALSFADRLAVMRTGQIEQAGTPEDVYYQPRTLFCAQFLGRTNLLLSQAHGEEADSPIGSIRLAKSAEGNVLVSLRPEHLTLDSPESNGDGPVGTVVERAFKGHDITFRVQCNGNDYLVHTHNRISYGIGDAVKLRALEPAVVLERREIG